MVLTDLGRNLGLTVVAEGVENAEIWEALRLLRCDEAQGYFLTKPLPADELTRWLDNPNRVSSCRRTSTSFRTLVRRSIA